MEITTTIETSTGTDVSTSSSITSITTSVGTTSTLPFLQKPFKQYQPNEMGFSILIICVVVCLFVTAFKKGF